MPRKLAGFIAVAIVLALGSAALAAPAPKTTAQAHKKRQVTKQHVTRWHGYGFLPGYRPPYVIERERAKHYWQSGPHYYGPAWPRFYRGRWNGGGFGPCYTQTPIGPMWNCGQ